MNDLMSNGPNPELRDRLLPLMKWLFAQPNPIGLNTMLAMLGCIEPVFRLPYVPYDSDLRAEGAALIQALGLEHTPGQAIRHIADDQFKILKDWWRS